MDIDTSLLSDEEQALLETLIGKLELPKKAQRVPKEPLILKPTNKLKPYNLKVVYLCSTCSSVTISVFKMLPSMDGTGLVSVRTEEDVQVDATTKRSCKTCAHCRNYLMLKDKDELVSLYLTAMVVM